MVSAHVGDSTSLPSTNLTSLGLLQYLQEDTRPSFIINLRANQQTREAGVHVEFANHAFDRIDAARLSLASLAAPVDNDTVAFVAWFKQPICAKSLELYDLTWNAVTVHDEWRVISGTPIIERATVLSDNRQNPEQTHAQDDFDDSQFDSSYPMSPPITDIFDVITSYGTASSRHCQYIRDFDWASTPIGPIHRWPQQLLQFIPLLLSNPEPCTIFWGKKRTMIFNEPYISLIRDLHLQAMGSSPLELFGQEVWGPFDQAMRNIDRTKRAIRQEAVMIHLDRSIGVEETFFNYTFTPLLAPAGHVRGIFCHVTEVTQQIVAQRQLGHLISIGEGTSSATSLESFWAGMSRSLPRCAADLPFVAAYSLDCKYLVNSNTSLSRASSTSSDPDMWYLQSSYGFPPEHSATLATLNIHEDVGLAPALRLALANSGLLIIRKDQKIVSDSVFDNCLDSGVGSKFNQLAICPLSLSSDKIASFLIFGLNPLRPYDDAYARFLNLLSHQIEDTATSVLLLEKDKLHMQQTVDQAEYQRQWLSEQLQQQTKEARESELRFYNFAKQAPVGVYILGPEGEIKFCNDAWYRLVGLPIGFQGPVPWRTQVHPDDLEEVDRQWQRLVDGHTQKNYEWRVLRSPRTGDDSKDIVYLRSSCFPELAEDGSMKTVTGVLMDLSVHKAHERAVAERLTSVLEAKRAQERFMDMVSHEMRNPLNAMLQCAGEAAQILGPFTNPSERNSNASSGVADALEAIETIRYCGRHQKQIIDDVLTISKLDSNLVTLCPMEATPISVIDQAVKMFASDIRAANIDVTRNYASEGNYTPCLLDSSRVLQILINLIGNAIKFLKDRPVKRLNLSVITTKTRPMGSEVKFISSGRQRKHLASPVDWGAGDPVYIYYSVRDTGPGMTPEEMNNLFARFKQASPRTHAQYGGSGLGLFISRELAELHGGEIGLASKVRQGSTFAFYVEGHVVVRPLASSAINPSADHERSAPTTQQTMDESTTSENSEGHSDLRQISPVNITILIVEDNVVNQNVLQRQLRRLGYKTQIANNGQEALDAIQRSRWRVGNHDEGTPTLSIVLCDLEMPIMDGMTLVRLIRDAQRDGWLTADIPMIAVTGNARVEQTTAAKKAGFNSVVCKPYNIPDLVPIMADLIKSDDS